jgi:hypothetical protein
MNGELASYNSVIQFYTLSLKIIYVYIVTSKNNFNFTIFILKF